MRKSPIAFGTRMPIAIVCASSQRAAWRVPSSQARTIGAQPLACTAYMRGRLPGGIKPIASSSANAFHMPINPVPPPVG